MLREYLLDLIADNIQGPIYMPTHALKIAQNTYYHLKQYLTRSDVVLDIGSGTGCVANLIKKNTGARVICLDITNNNKAIEKPVLFCGKHIPFCNEAFSISICCFVLHHTQFQIELLDEIKRVTKSKIIILEDVIENLLDYPLVFIHQVYSRIYYKSLKTKFRSEDDWRDLFSKSGLLVEKVKKIEKTREITYPVSRRAFILSKAVGGLT